MNPSADLTISRFFDARNTAVVATSSERVPSDMSSAQGQHEGGLPGYPGLTLELEDQPGQSTNTRTDHVWRRARQSSTDHGDKLLHIGFHIALHHYQPSLSCSSLVLTCSLHLLLIVTSGILLLLLDDTTLGHLLRHYDQKLETGISGPLVNLLGSEDRFGQQLRYKVKTVFRQGLYQRREQLQSILEQRSILS